MAIDLMIMPLSRYWTGDFVTPAMRECWAQGLPYAIVTPGAPMRHLPPGIPFGGADAPSQRAASLPLLLENLQQLPFNIPARLWDEASSSEPRFHRVDPISLEALQAEAHRHLEKRPSSLGRLFGRASYSSHLLNASLFLPAPFSEVFVTADIPTGSLHTLRTELGSRSWSQPCQAALSSWLGAIRDAFALRLPLIVDM